MIYNMEKEFAPRWSEYMPSLAFPRVWYGENKGKGEKNMDKVKSILLAATLGLALALTISCSSDDGDDNPPVSSKKETYYTETGGVSVQANDLINSTPGISAADALKILNQYSVLGDKYKSAKPGVSRAELEEDLDKLSISISGFSKEQVLRILDTRGRTLMFLYNNVSDLVYIYVEKE
jgi:hypothetical protein